MGQGLSPKERRFVAEYLKDQNGTQAAIRAGYSRHTANEQAARLLARVSVSAAVDKRLKKVEVASELTAERVRRAILAVLEFDPRDAFNNDGTLKEMSKLPDSVALAIAGIDVDDSVGDIKKLRFSDRIRAAEIAAKILGLVKLELTTKNPLVQAPINIDFSRVNDATLHRIANMRNGSNGNGERH